MADEIPYVERLRTSAIRPATCCFCGKHAERPEFHHECYRPERGLLLCHECHHKVHFRPWQLTVQEKEKLLFFRHGFQEYNRRRADHAAWQRELSSYVAPGRREAQLEVRREARERAQTTNVTRAP